MTNWQLPPNLWVRPIKPWGQDKSVLPMFFQLLCFKTLFWAEDQWSTYPNISFTEILRGSPFCPFWCCTILCICNWVQKYSFPNIQETKFPNIQIPRYRIFTNRYKYRDNEPLQISRYRNILNPKVPLHRCSILWISKSSKLELQKLPNRVQDF